MLGLLNPTIKYFQIFPCWQISGANKFYIKIMYCLYQCMPALKTICDRPVYVLIAMNEIHIKGIKTV